MDTSCTKTFPGFHTLFKYRDNDCSVTYLFSLLLSPTHSHYFCLFLHYMVFQRQRSVVLRKLVKFMTLSSILLNCVHLFKIFHDPQIGCPSVLWVFFLQPCFILVFWFSGTGFNVTQIHSEAQDDLELLMLSPLLLECWDCRCSPLCLVSASGMLRQPFTHCPPSSALSALRNLLSTETVRCNHPPTYT